MLPPTNRDIQWRRQNVKTARSFPGQYGRKAGHLPRLTFCSKEWWVTPELELGQGRWPGNTVSTLVVHGSKST